MSTQNGKLGLLILVLVGCASADAPLDELTLRDALNAHPDVIASMPFEARRALAVRLHAAYLTQPTSPLDPHGTTVRDRVRASDAARADQGDDAAIALVPQPAQLLTLIQLPPLDGRDATSPTDGLEASALRGTAGQVLSATLAANHATHLVRVTQWPTAIAADGDTVYVNASYLVAMAAYDQPTSTANDTGTGSADPLPPNVQPTPYTFCSVAGEDASRGRRVFWILGPLAFVVIRGRAWRRRSKRG